MLFNVGKRCRSQASPDKKEMCQRRHTCHILEGQGMFWLGGRLADLSHIGPSRGVDIQEWSPPYPSGSATVLQPYRITPKRVKQGKRKI